MFGIGCFFIVVSVLWFVFKIYLAYDAARCPQGGGGVPTLEGALLPPLGLVYGLSKIRIARPEIELPNFWIVWLIATAIGLAIHFGIGRFVKTRRLENTRAADKE